VAMGVAVSPKHSYLSRRSLETWTGSQTLELGDDIG
jgi:hypothetical protein